MGDKCCNAKPEEPKKPKTDSKVPEELKKSAAKNMNRAHPLDNYEMETALRNAGISW